MARILHLTDFHLDPKNLKDWNNYVKPALFAKLSELSEDGSVDLVCFTGDMIDQGGKAYGSARPAFDLFKSDVMDEILKHLSLPMERFFIIPGNHDIERHKDPERIEVGNQYYFARPGKLSEFMLSANSSKSFEGMERMKAYKEFEQSLYSGSKGIRIDQFGMAGQFKTTKEHIGVCGLNTSWRCWDKHDMGRLFIGEDQLATQFKHVSNCNLKIALMHHPLDWLSEVEKVTITNHITRDFDLLLTGHVHENRTSLHTGFNGTLFVNVAPGGVNDIRSDSRTFANGFTVLHFDKANREVDCKYFRYVHNTKQFVPNTDQGDNGRFIQTIPVAKSPKKLDLIKSVIQNIKDDHFPLMDDHLMNVKAKVAPSSIREGFVLPPIVEGRADNEQPDPLVSVSELVKSRQSFVFFGGQESGKTVLLFRLIREFVDEFELLRRIPVYIDFHEIGSKDLPILIKEYLRCGTDDVKELLNDKQIVLLLDNLDYSEEANSFHQAIKVHKFNKEHEDIQIIATSPDVLSGILPTEFIEQCKIPFRHFFIRSLKTREIKQIMRQWIPEESEMMQEARLEKLVNSFNSYALPSTAMSVSLFLWSMENKDRKPINNAVLMEIYIEIMLEKLSKDNIYRESFDFTNKIQLLAKIAQQMQIAGQPSYSILYSEFVKTIETYLRDLVGFQYDVQVIVDYFLARKIFVKYQGIRIKFTYSCFFHFFIAKRMEYDPEFRAYVMEEQHYYKFYKEIDYYTGLTRSDEKMLSEVFQRFEHEFAPSEFILSKINIDDHFTLRGRPEPVAKNLEITTIKQNRPTKDQMEEFYNRRLEQIPNPGEILRKEGSLTLERMIILMSNVLRNSEGVENLELKRKAYAAIIKNSMTWMILYREYLVEFIVKHKRLPGSVGSDVSIDYVLNNIPYHVQMGLSQHLGTSKLSSLMLEKIKLDNRRASTTQDVESFLSVALYSDLHAGNFDRYLKSFVKRVRNNIVRDYLLYKLLDYYYRRTKPGSSNEGVYLDILSELRIRSQGLPKRLKERIIKTYQDGKKQFQKEFLDLDS